MGGSKYLLKTYMVLFLLITSYANADSRPAWPHSITYSYTEGAGKVKGNSYKLLIHMDNVEWSRVDKSSPEKYDSAKSAIFVKLDGDNYMISWFEKKQITVTMVFNTKSKSINTISSTNEGNNLTSGKLSEINW